VVSQGPSVNIIGFRRSLIKLTAVARYNQYVALKILIANPEASKHELAILEALSHSSIQGKNHVMNLLDFFEHKGPNGVHRCLVFKVMGPSVADAPEDLPDDVSNEQGSFPIWMVKRILHHTLLGIEFLHANGIAHGDLQQGNLLFPVKDLNAVDERELSRNDQISEPVRRLDGRTDLWAPRYLALDQPLSQYIDAGPEFNIKISDLGGGMFTLILCCPDH
jgi:serine/threonine protein kinase